ncbi:MAG: ATP-binding protein [Bdellovibrionota bacterium]
MVTLQEGEDALRQLRDIKFALDQSAIVAIADRAGNITHVNKKFCEISKYSAQELLYQNHRILKSGFHPPEFYAEMWKTISNGLTWQGEVKNKAKDGTFYWVNTTIVPFFDLKGEPDQYVSIRFDITARKEAEAKVLVQDRLASVGMMASSLAHEIGNPLGVIRGRAEYLEMQLKGNESAEKNLHIIISQIDRVSELIKSLLRLARGQVTGKPESVSINQVMVDVLDLMGHEFRKNEITILNGLENINDLFVLAEAGPLHQVFLNVFVNAIHAIQSAVRGNRKTGHQIKISFEDQKTAWRVTTEDTGCGIDPENMKNLFKPFFTTKEIGAGTGLGLATSYNIVQQWQGDILVESTAGVGTKFHIQIPKVKVST